MSIMLKYLIALPVIVIALRVSASDCATIYSAEHADIAGVTLEKFDQTEGSGWRRLADANCFSEAESLISDYLQTHSGASGLYTHLGQLQLRQNKLKDAAVSLKKAQRKEDPSSEFKFNSFVLALAAYAEGNRGDFEMYRENLVLHRENYGNKMNLHLLDAVYENFDKRYMDILEILKKEK